MICCDMCNIPLEQPINKNKFFLTTMWKGMVLILVFTGKKKFTFV